MRVKPICGKLIAMMLQQIVRQQKYVSTAVLLASNLMVCWQLAHTSLLSQQLAASLQTNKLYCWFSHTRPASMYFNQEERKSLHKNRTQFPEDLSGTRSWSLFFCLGAQIWPP